MSGCIEVKRARKRRIFSHYRSLRVSDLNLSKTFLSHLRKSSSLISVETESKRGFLLFEHDWLLQHMKASPRHTDPRAAIDILEREDKEKLQNKQDGEEKLSRGEELDFIEFIPLKRFTFVTLQFTTPNNHHYTQSSCWKETDGAWWTKEISRKKTN